MPNSMKVFLGAPYHIDRSTFLEGVAGVFKTGHRTLYESLSSLVVGLFYSFAELLPLYLWAHFLSFLFLTDCECVVFCFILFPFHSDPL